MRPIMVLFLVISLQSLFGQSPSILIYGSIGTNSSISKQIKNKSSYIYTGIGYEYKTGWTLGIELGKEITKENNHKISNYSELGAFLQYFHALDDHWGIFSTFSLGYANLKEPNIDRLNGYYGRVTPGIYVSVAQKFGLYFVPGNLSFNKLGDDKNFDFNFGLAPIIGVSKNIYFKSKSSN